MKSASEVTPSQLAVLHHTLGISIHQRKPYRNYFVAGNGHHDMPDLEALEKVGLLGRARTPAFCDPSDIVFCTTATGRAFALEQLPEPPPPAKHSQHRQWLDADTGYSFKEWLCGGRMPKYESRGWRREKNLEYRMYRHSGYSYAERDVQGDWASTKKAAKASYKAALKAKKDKESKD